MKKYCQPYAGNAFGETVPTSSNGYVLNFRFPGQYFDQESGLVSNGFRTYCLECGRYLQSDPIGLAGGMSTYSYVDNNPLIYTDPLGKASQVYVNGTNVLIIISIAYVGGGDALHQQWNDAISDKWSGVFGDLTVTTVVTNGDPSSVGTNVVTVEPAGTRSNVSWYRHNEGQDTAKWACDASSNVIGHEAGHLMHLPDVYVDVSSSGTNWGVTSHAFPGFENDLMGTNPDASPSEQDIIGVINANAKKGH